MFKKLFKKKTDAGMQYLLFKLLTWVGLYAIKQARSTDKAESAMDNTCKNG